MIFLKGDITKKDTLVEPSTGKDAVVCTVGAQAGWRLPGANHYTPRFVDYQGVKNLSEVAASVKVSRLGLKADLLLISSMYFMCWLSLPGGLIPCINFQKLFTSLEHSEFRHPGSCLSPPWALHGPFGLSPSCSTPCLAESCIGRAR